jgi:hypothetical protein
MANGVRSASSSSSSSSSELKVATHNKSKLHNWLEEEALLAHTDAADTLLQPSEGWGPSLPAANIVSSAAGTAILTATTYGISCSWVGISGTISKTAPKGRCDDGASAGR